MAIAPEVRERQETILQELEMKTPLPLQREPEGGSRAAWVVLLIFLTTSACAMLAFGYYAEQRQWAWRPLVELKAVPVDHPTAFTFTYPVTGQEKTPAVQGTAYVVRQKGAAPVVLPGTCPQHDVAVQWNEQAKAFICPKDGSRFDVRGHPLGRAISPALEHMRWKVEGGTLYIRLRKGGLREEPTWDTTGWMP